jgi:hypothetical protein
MKRNRRLAADRIFKYDQQQVFDSSSLQNIIWTNIISLNDDKKCLAKRKKGSLLYNNIGVKKVKIQDLFLIVAEMDEY